MRTTGAREAGVPSLTPTAVHEALQDALSRAGLDEVWVGGTVSSLRRGPRFTSLELVDYEADHATVSATLAVGMFAREAEYVERTLRRAGAELCDGLDVRFHGRLEPNPRFGKVRLLVDDVDVRTSVGAAVVARDQLVESLAASGALERQRTRRVPACPRRVGLVSANGAAGRADVLHVLGESGLSFSVEEEVVAMSGASLAASLAGALERLSRRGVDVIVIARGGGARSDLSAWDNAEVAKAIASCRVPVWVAVGHATDHGVADMVANRSFPTPSAAAGELVAMASGHALDAGELSRSQQHADELARARRRMRIAVAIAIVAVLVLLRLLL